MDLKPINPGGNSPVLAKKFRGKPAKEVYRFVKGVWVTGSILKPMSAALSTITGEMTQGFIYSSAGSIGEKCILYLSGVGFIGSFYRVIHPSKLKVGAQIIYNIVGLPLTLYSKGFGGAFDLLQLSKLEELWFGAPVYLFDDNRFWIEKNFTLGDRFEAIE